MVAGVDLGGLGSTLENVVEQVLDTAVGRAVTDPLPLHTPEEVRAAVEGSSGATVTAFMAPALTGIAKRLSNRVVSLGSKMSFSVKALLAAVPPLTSSVTLGTREFHALASYVTNRLRGAGLPVDRRLVQRLTVNAYAWPGGGHDLESPHPVAALRVAGLWVTRPLAHERHGEWVGRAAESIAAADLAALADRFSRAERRALDP
jgi:hypothetical protein